MAVVTGTRYSYTDSSNVAIDMSDTLSLIDPSDVPLLSLVGHDSLSKECTELKHEWLEDTLRSLTGFTVDDNPLTSGATTLNVASGEGVNFGAGDILLVESELIYVSSVSTDALTVSRGYGGSSAASHAQGTGIDIVGSAAAQDADPGPARTTTVSGLFNYVQIYNTSITVTSIDRAIDRYAGPSDELSRKLDHETRVAWQTWERSLLHGKKVQPTSGNTGTGAMDGILARISTNTYAKSGADFSEAFLLDALQDIWTAGGRASHIVLNAFQKRQANAFLDSMRMTTRTDRVAGVIVDTYTSDFGTVDIVLDRNMPTDTVLVIDKARVGFGPLRAHALHAEKIPQTTALKETWQIVGAYTAEVRNEAAHAAITGLSTS